jgi:hypothetical protein
MDRVTLLACTLIIAAACDSPEKRATGSAVQSAPPPEVSAAPPTAPAKPVLRRPDNLGELILNDERRARIESAYPEARGFLDLDVLEKELFALELRRGGADKALVAFDRRARGKWVLFTSKLIDPEADAFEAVVHYTARDAKDPLGLTSTWFPVRFDKIEGLEPKRYRPGDLVVLLAKYQGKQRAGPGYDLILLDRWFEPPGR